MEWISGNWIWLLLALGMVGLHMFGHGRGSRGRQGAARTHAGHGGGCCGGGMSDHGHDHDEKTPQFEKTAGGVQGNAVSAGHSAP